ncbi:TSUP family transporter [Tepidibacillus decaturensis]|uniref:Probable membrane transporter protein n=1 Tax=Tepidibacillus decaturensis TaxID=1413211 RepID=A0A135L517_9BACI|nr:TSUP family transporter [Tepidibacillus decaturensis]KXG44078.1 hypothetical protein U473_08715 [Tepidibacillus decaturensis]
MSMYALAVLIILIVGVVTLYLKITIDRIFLVLLLMFWLKIDIHQAIIINGLVMLLASFLFVRGNKEQILQIPKNVFWPVAIIAFIGGLVGRWFGSSLDSKVLMIILGVYAVLVGLRLVLLKPKLVQPGQLKPVIAVISFLFSILTGLISAGGKPIQIPLLMKTQKLSMPQAYMMGSIGTMFAVIGLLTGQVLVDYSFFQAKMFSWAWVFYVGFSLIMILFEKKWSPKGQRIMSYIVGPLLILVGFRLFI